jgi:hypothetical protein
MVVALAQRPQVQSLNRTVFLSILDIHRLVVFCPGWQTPDWVESHLVDARHLPEIMDK